MDSPPSHTAKQEETHILFLDGECVFCQRTAQLLHRWDKSQTLFFSSLQGETASMLPTDWRNTTDARGRPAGNAVLVEHAGEANESRWCGADAILRALLLTKSPLAPLWVLHYLPRMLKDGFYSLVARKRHRLVRDNRCPLPSESFKEKSLP